MKKMRILKAELAQALSARVLSTADANAANLDTEVDALIARQNQAAAEHHRRYAAGVAASDSAIQHAEARLPIEYREELRLVVASQQQALCEHDAIRMAEVSIQLQGCWQHESTNQCSSGTVWSFSKSLSTRPS